MGADMLRINPARTVSPPAPLHRDLPTGLSASIATCGCRRLQLNRYLADLAGELEGHKVRPRHGPTFAYSENQRPRPPKKILGCVRPPLPVRIVALGRVPPPAK